MDAPRPTDPCPQCGGRGTEDHSWDVSEACPGCGGTGSAPRPTSDLPTGCANDPEFCRCPEHRPTSALAADVLHNIEARAMQQSVGDGKKVWNVLAADVLTLLEDRRALVARITDLEAQVVDLLEGRDYSTWAQRVEAAEAQVAALTQERDGWNELCAAERGRGDHHLAGKEAAEAALATTRQALTGLVSALECTRGAIAGLPPHAKESLDAARRALAAEEPA